MSHRAKRPLSHVGDGERPAQAGAWPKEGLRGQVAPGTEPELQFLFNE